jgi:hypothetical protein
MTRPTILPLLRVFFAAGTSLQSCYLTKIGGYTDSPTDTPLTRHDRCRGNVLAEPLLSIEKKDILYRAFA